MLGRGQSRTLEQYVSLEQHWDILSSDFFAFLSGRAMLDVKCYARSFRLACWFKSAIMLESGGTL